MIKYLYFCKVMEQHLLESNIFNDLNMLDVARGGQDFSSKDLIDYMSTNAFDGGMQPLSVFKFEDFNEFLNCYFNVIMSYSNLTDFEFNNLKSKLKSYATIKVGVKNYSKQLYLLEIANAVLNAKYEFSAFTIINE